MRLLVIVIEVLADVVTWLTVIISSLVGMAVDGKAAVAGRDVGTLVSAAARPDAGARMHSPVLPVVVEDRQDVPSLAAQLHSKSRVECARTASALREHRSAAAPTGSAISELLNDRARADLLCGCNGTTHCPSQSIWGFNSTSSNVMSFVSPLGNVKRIPLGRNER